MDTELNMKLAASPKDVAASIDVGELYKALHIVASYLKLIRVGYGSPETVITAPVGTTYHRLDGGAGTTLYVKESGTGNTGWVGK